MLSTIIKQANCLSAAMLLAMGVTAAALILSPEESHGKSVPADRVVVRFQQDDHQGAVFEVISRKQITKVLPPSDELPTVDSPVSGFYYELRSADGTVLYRRIINNPVPLVVEVPVKSLEAVASGEKTPTVDRKETIPRERIFTLVIPRAGPGDQLVIFSSPLQTGERAGLQKFGRPADPAQEVARITLIPSTPQREEINHESQ